MEERLQKILARQGYGSRRFCEQMIAEGRVRLNGSIAQLGNKADIKRDDITVDGRQIARTEVPKLYIALHKPRGVLSDIDPKDSRPNVRGMIPVEEHLFAVGRLDYDSEGLMLLTNDGELANQLTHPRYGHEKEYRVLVVTKPDAEQLTLWRRGVVLEDGHRTLPARVWVEAVAGKGAWLRVVLREGRKRQIREIGHRIGLPVRRIVRVRICTLELGNLKIGEWRYLTDNEVAQLKEFVREHSGSRKVSSRPGKGRRAA